MEGGEEQFEAVIVIEQELKLTPYSLDDFPNPRPENMPGKFQADRPETMPKKEDP